MRKKAKARVYGTRHDKRTASAIFDDGDDGDDGDDDSAPTPSSSSSAARGLTLDALPDMRRGGV